MYIHMLTLAFMKLFLLVSSNKQESTHKKQQRPYSKQWKSNEETHLVTGSVLVKVDADIHV